MHNAHGTCPCVLPGPLVADGALSLDLAAPKQDARYAIIQHVVHLVNRDYQVDLLPLLSPCSSLDFHKVPSAHASCCLGQHAWCSLERRHGCAACALDVKHGWGMRDHFHFTYIIHS